MLTPILIDTYNYQPNIINLKVFASIKTEGKTLSNYGVDYYEDFCAAIHDRIDLRLQRFHTFIELKTDFNLKSHQDFLNLINRLKNQDSNFREAILNVQNNQNINTLNLETLSASLTSYYGSIPQPVLDASTIAFYFPSEIYKHDVYKNFVINELIITNRDSIAFNNLAINYYENNNGDQTKDNESNMCFKSGFHDYKVCDDIVNCYCLDNTSYEYSEWYFMRLTCASNNKDLIIDPRPVIDSFSEELPVIPFATSGRSYSHVPLIFRGGTSYLDYTYLIEKSPSFNEKVYEIGGEKMRMLNSTFLHVIFNQQDGSNHVAFKYHPFDSYYVDTASASAKFVMQQVNQLFKFYIVIDKNRENVGHLAPEDLHDNLDMYQQGEKLYLTCTDDKLMVEREKEIGMTQFFKLTPSSGVNSYEDD